MRFLSLPIAAFPFAATLALFAFESASAGDLPFVKGEPTAPSIASCDFYQSQLIGAFCANTFGGTATLDQEQLRYKYSNFAVTDNWRRDWFETTGAVYIAPAPWLKLSFDSEHNNYSYLFSAANKFGQGFVDDTARLNNFAWQTLNATVRLLDYSGEGFRAFVSATGFASFLPAYSSQGISYSGRTEFAGTLTAGAHWVLGNSNFSLNPYASVEIAHYSAPEQNQFASTVRLLLSQDAWGVAAGPIVTTDAINYHATNGNAFQSQQYYAGAHLLFAPFRLAGAPVLKDAVANFDVLHSLGQAGTVYYSIPNADEMIYKGSLQFNFTY